MSTITSATKVIWEECEAVTQLWNEVPIGYNGILQIHPQNCPFPYDDNQPHITHPSLDQPHSPPQTASGSTQPFCHSTLSEQTDRQKDQPTDGLGEKPVPRVFMLCW